MVKGNIGAGILALPRAVSLAGLWVGCIGIAVLSLFCVTCMHLIVECSHRLSAKAGRSYMSYADVAEFTFSTSPNKSLHKFAGFFRYSYLYKRLHKNHDFNNFVSIELCQCHNLMTINSYRNFIDVFLVFTQVGFCCVYFVFIPQNIFEVSTSQISKLNQKHFVNLNIMSSHRTRNQKNNHFE